MVPVTWEEQAICFADKFYSKNSFGKGESVEKARKMFGTLWWKKGYGALIIGANSSCSNLNFFKKGDYLYK